MTEQVKPDWETAEVSDGALTVALSAEPPKRWRNAFEQTATLLNNGSWTVSLDKKGSVRVDPVEQGDEDRVREFIEGAALEANSTLVGEDELFGREPAEGEDEDEERTPEAEAAESTRDEALTERFRAFAGEGESDEDEA